MKCKICGEVIPDKEPFCPKCGTPAQYSFDGQKAPKKEQQVDGGDLIEEATPPKKPFIHGKKKFWIIVGIALAFVIGGLTLLYFCLLEPTPKYRLTVSVQWWIDLGLGQPYPEVSVYDNIMPGTVVCESTEYCESIIVNEVTNDYIRLKINGSSFRGGGLTPETDGSENKNDILLVPLGQTREIRPISIDLEDYTSLQLGYIGFKFEEIRE